MNSGHMIRLGRVSPSSFLLLVTFSLGLSMGLLLPENINMCPESIIGAKTVPDVIVVVALLSTVRQRSVSPIEVFVPTGQGQHSPARLSEPAALGGRKGGSCSAGHHRLPLDAFHTAYVLKFTVLNWLH